MHKGISLQATYTYSHSIDDASSVGGSGNSIAQNDQNLGAEESNSSFDRRHTLSGNFVIEPPFGPNRAFLNKGGVMAKILDGYSISGNFTFASGNFATPTYRRHAGGDCGGRAAIRCVPTGSRQSITGRRHAEEWFNTGGVRSTRRAAGQPTATRRATRSSFRERSRSAGRSRARSRSARRAAWRCG